MVTFLAESALLRLSRENRNWWFRSASEPIVRWLGGVAEREVKEEPQPRRQGLLSENQKYAVQLKGDR